MAESFRFQFGNPMQVVWMVHNGGVSGVLGIMEPALDIEVRGVDKGGFKNLGHRSNIDP